MRLEVVFLVLSFVTASFAATVDITIGMDGPAFPLCKGTWADFNGCKSVVVSSLCRRFLDRFGVDIKINGGAHVHKIIDIDAAEKNDTYDDPYRHSFSMLFPIEDLKLPAVNISDNAVDLYSSCELSAVDLYRPSFEPLMVIPNSICLSQAHEQIPNSNQFCAIDYKYNNNNNDSFSVIDSGLGLLCKESPLSEEYLVGILTKKIKTNYWPSITSFFEFINLNKLAPQMEDACINMMLYKNSTKTNF